MKKLILHPFLFTVFPILSLWAVNVSYIPANMVFRSLLIFLLITLAIFLILHFITRDWLKAGIIASVLILMVFSYGRLYLALRDVSTLNSIIRHRYLLPFAILISISFIFLIWKKDHLVAPITLLLNVIGLTLVVIPLFSLLLFQLSAISSGVEYKATQSRLEVSDQGRQPDIYYIILDGYGRQDILQELYKYDNSEFIQALRERGFYIADKSNSNYMQTLLSLSSSLNMDYMDGFISQNGGRLSVPYGNELINNSQLRRILREQGYEMVAYESSFEDLSKADVFLKELEQKHLLTQTILPINEFESILIDTTLAKVWLDAYIGQNGNASSVLMLPYLQHGNRVIYILTDLGNVAKMPGKKFVIAHVVSPHPPFVFDRNGGIVAPQTPYALADGDDYKGGPAEYISGYTEQIQYINRLALKAIDDIIANSPVPPIILIQGDHGPGAYLKWGSLEDSNVNERMAILNAYYFPNQDYDALYPSISPVNSFRVILNDYFGSKMDLLPDNHYFSANFDYSIDSSWTVDFINVDEQLDEK